MKDAQANRTVMATDMNEACLESFANAAQMQLTVGQVWASPQLRGVCFSGPMKEGRSLRLDRSRVGRTALSKFER